MPEVTRADGLGDAIGALPAIALRLAARGRRRRSSRPAAARNAAQPIVLLIGPEGGLADNERKFAHANGFAACRLGPRVMRTETAGLAALAMLQTMAGDFS